MDTKLQSRTVKASGAYDAIVLLPFALPICSHWILDQVRILNQQLSLPGELPEMSHAGVLFLNMMAALGMLYGFARIRHPNQLLGKSDLIARVLMAVLLSVYLIWFDLPGLLWMFVAMEIFWAGALFFVVRGDASSLMQPGLPGGSLNPETNPNN